MMDSVEPPCERDTEALARLAGAVDRLSDHMSDQTDQWRTNLSGLQDVIEELRTQLQWACNNFLPEFRLRSMAADPLDPRWGQKLNGKLLRLSCSECDCPSPASLEEALRAGWSELMEDKTDDWDYLGLCPDCWQRLDDQTEATRRSVAPGEVRPSPILAHAVDNAETLIYCCEQPCLAWNGEPDAPGVACTNCGYTVAEMGQLVAMHVERTDQSSVAPRATETVTDAGPANFLWADD